MSHVIIQFLLVLLRPAFKRRAVRKYGIAGIAHARINGSQSSHCTLRLGTLQTRSLVCLLRLLYRGQDSVDVLQTLSFAGCALHNIGWPAIDESAKIGDEERVLDIGQGREGLNFRVCSRQQDGLWTCSMPTYRLYPRRRPCWTSSLSRAVPQVRRAGGHLHPRAPSPSPSLSCF